MKINYGVLTPINNYFIKFILTTGHRLVKSWRFVVSKEGEVPLLVRGLSSINTNGGFYIRSGANNILVGYGCLGTEGDKIKSPVVISLSSKKMT